MNILGGIFDFVTDWIFAGIGQYMAQRSWRVLALFPTVMVAFVAVMVLVTTHSPLALAWTVLMGVLLAWLIIDLVRNLPDVSP